MMIMSWVVELGETEGSISLHSLKEECSSVCTTQHIILKCQSMQNRKITKYLFKKEQSN